MVERRDSRESEGEPRIPGIRTSAHGRPGASCNAEDRDLSGRRRSRARRQPVNSRAWSRSHAPSAGRSLLLIPRVKARESGLRLEQSYPVQGGTQRGDPMTPPPRLVFMTMVATLAYLGLAILGWGGVAAFFSHPALIALTIVGFLLSGVALFSSGNLSPGEREDRGNRWVLAVFSLIGLLMAYLPAYTDRKEFWTLDRDAVRWLGVILFAAGGALRIWPVFVL